MGLAGPVRILRDARVSRTADHRPDRPPVFSEGGSALDGSLPVPPVFVRRQWNRSCAGAGVMADLSGRRALALRLACAKLQHRHGGLRGDRLAAGRTVFCGI